MTHIPISDPPPLPRLDGRNDADADFLVGWLHDGGLQRVALPTRADLALVGCHAPASWVGAAVCTSGIVCVDIAPQVVDLDCVGVVVVADRFGRGPVVLTPDHPRGIDVEPSPIPDALLRFLGRSSAPPSCATSALAHLVWLHRVLEAALMSAKPHRLTWLFAASLHPAAYCAGSLDPDSMGDAATRFDRKAGWRELADGIDDPVLEAPAGVLDWFDRGSHHRWCMTRLPDPRDILHDLAHLLDPGLWRQVVGVLTAGSADGSREGSRTQ